MRFVFKTSYNQDIQIFRDKVDFGWYAALALLAVGVGPCPAQTAGWKPARPIEIIVGVSPGGGIDRTARTLQKIMQDKRYIEVATTVINKPGGGGALVQAYMNQHAGDAHYFEISATSVLTNHIAGKSPHNWDAFTPIAMLADEHIGFVVNVNSPLKTAKE